MLSTGFTDAPVTRSLVYGIVGASILVSVMDIKHYFYIQVDPHFWRYHQIWRALIYQLCFTNSTEVLFAAMTLYNMRVIERLWGSRKYAVSLIYPLFSIHSYSKYDIVIHTFELLLHSSHPTNAPCIIYTANFIQQLQLPTSGSDALNLCDSSSVSCGYSTCI